MDGIFNMIGRITYYCYLGYTGLLGNHLVPSVSLDYMNKIVVGGVREIFLIMQDDQNYLMRHHGLSWIL